MITITLTRREFVALHEVLTEKLSDLRWELNRAKENNSNDSRAAEKHSAISDLYETVMQDNEDD